METGLQYNRARFYDPATGRWISQDRLGFDAGDSNLYRYVRNEPISQTDPKGLQAFSSRPMTRQEKAEWENNFERQGNWDAWTFFKKGLGLSPWQGSFLAPKKNRMTWNARIYSKGCFGLVELRIGKDPYDSSIPYYTDLDDAVKKAKTIGRNARLIAIQWTGDADYKAFKEDGYPSRIIPARHSEGNHLTWHQKENTFGFWEYLGPWGMGQVNTNRRAEGLEPFEHFQQWAEYARVYHVRYLPRRENTIYGVATVPPMPLRPPLTGALKPNPVGKNE